MGRGFGINIFSFDLEIYTFLNVKSNELGWMSIDILSQYDTFMYDLLILVIL